MCCMSYWDGLRRPYPPRFFQNSAQATIYLLLTQPAGRMVAADAVDVCPMGSGGLGADSSRPGFCRIAFTAAIYLAAHREDTSDCSLVPAVIYLGVWLSGLAGLGAEIRPSAKEQCKSAADRSAHYSSSTIRGT